MLNIHLIIDSMRKQSELSKKKKKTDEKIGLRNINFMFSQESTRKGECQVVEIIEVKLPFEYILSILYCGTL